MPSGIKKILNLLANKRFALGLFLLAALFLIPETVNKTLLPYSTPVKLTLFVLLFASLCSCTVVRFQHLRQGTIIIHAGCVFIIIGAVLGHLGFVATVNVYEGEGTKTAYRWDLEHDAPLGFEIFVEKIERSYYPVPVKIGILENGEKTTLVTVQTGDSFRHGETTVTVDSIDLDSKSLDLTIQQPGSTSHLTTTREDGSSHALDFKLVAFQDPILRRIWVELGIVSDKETIDGISEVNNPFVWDGMRIFNTANGLDPDGRPYAGLQIVRDPGIPLVYLGFLLVLLGGIIVLRHHLFTQKEGRA